MYEDDNRYSVDANNAGETNPPVDLMVSLRWSLEPPKTPGWYWCKNHHGVSKIEQVHTHPDLPDVMTVLENTFTGWRHIRINNMDRQWSGPISEPMEAN